MSTAVIYQSKSGYTRRYAQWLAESLDAKLFLADSATSEDLIPFDLLIYGGGLYASGINGLKAFFRKLESMPNKQLIIFAVGVTPPRENLNEELIKHNIPVNLQDSILFFYLRGGFDAHTLTTTDRLLMGLLKLKLRFKREKTPDERGMLAAYEKSVDFTRCDNLAAIVSCAKNLNSNGKQ